MTRSQVESLRVMLEREEESCARIRAERDRCLRALWIWKRMMVSDCEGPEMVAEFNKIVNDILIERPD